MKADKERLLVLRQIAFWFFGIVFWLALAIQILLSLLTWNNTVNYDYFCGNPLMADWARWFVISLFDGVFILPAGVWSISHRNERVGIFFLIGFVLFILSLVTMTIIGLVVGTVPDFVRFIGYAFG